MLKTLNNLFNTNNSSQISNWDLLPDELKIIILSELDTPDLNNMSLVSKKINNLIKNENDGHNKYLWHAIAKQCRIDVPIANCSKKRIIKETQKIHSRASAWDIKLGESHCLIPQKYFKEKFDISSATYYWQINLAKYRINENKKSYISQFQNYLFSKNTAPPISFIKKTKIFKKTLDKIDKKIDKFLANDIIIIWEDIMRKIFLKKEFEKNDFSLTYPDFIKKLNNPTYETIMKELKKLPYETIKKEFDNWIEENQNKIDKFTLDLNDPYYESSFNGYSPPASVKKIAIVVEKELILPVA